jgi:hypothetical protein
MVSETANVSQNWTRTSLTIFYSEHYAKKRNIEIQEIAEALV